MKNAIILMLFAVSFIACSPNDDNTGTAGAPIANNDTASTPMDLPILIKVLSNDVAGDNPIDASSVSIQINPANGRADVNTTNGEITYTPNNLYNGIDTFTYKICDTGNPRLCDTGKVTVTVGNITGGGTGDL